ncbi:substrate-binding periplasmic protein [Kiloniella sp.]|uniref:substrate-binding periplasmic protein n=1 Tax=Kiloniella sp. TaxID=1938587 RepID=UPI003B02C255
MVRIRLSVCTILFLLGSFFWMMPSVVFADGRSCTSVRINGSSEWYPVSMYSEDTKKFHGLAIGVAREVFRRLKIPVTVEPKLPWKRMLKQLRNGDFDLLLGGYWTQERALIYSYSDPILKDEIAVFVRKGEEFPLVELADLIGRVGLRPLGGSYGEKFDRYAKIYLSFHEVPEDLSITLLGAGRADYAVLGRYDGVHQLRETGELDRIVDLPWPVASNDVHFMLSNLSPCTNLLEDINKVIRDLHEEGFIQELEAQYLGGF